MRLKSGSLASIAVRIRKAANRILLALCSFDRQQKKSQKK